MVGRSAVEDSHSTLFEASANSYATISTMSSSFEDFSHFDPIFSPSVSFAVNLRKELHNQSIHVSRFFLLFDNSNTARKVKKITNSCCESNRNIARIKFFVLNFRYQIDVPI